ncbi:hypothetical protein IW140_004871 [Coemansia sp. RSA 1813]|nr:hypothetical protein LPJ74_003415 [Coemansia sp. RSA 1843]KAJ2217030.1 hypothetical protein EV179_000797 [Coemansia sp. RSA 487]KAJ2566545.1 hypothetical protein IW140_004871 [Coemansia sp. RSA 1813]
MGFLNRYLLLLVFNVMNVVAFGAIVSVAVINIIDHDAPTNLIIYYGYTGLLSLGLLFSEVRVPRLLNAQARFLFTYTGRGILLTYFGCIVYTNSLYNVIACIFTVSLGVVYFVVAWVPFVPLHNGLLYNFSRWSCEGTEQFYNSAETIPYSSQQEQQQEQQQYEENGGLGYAQTEKAQQTLPIVPPFTTNTAVASASAGASYHIQQDAKSDGSVHASSHRQVPYNGAIHHHRVSSQATAALEPSSHYSKHISAHSIVWPEPPLPDAESRGLNWQQHSSTYMQRSDASADPLAHSPKSNNPLTAGTCRLSNESFIYGITNEPKVPDSTGDDYLDSIINSSCFAREVLDPNDNESIVVRDSNSPSRSYGLAANVVGSSNGHGGESPPDTHVSKRSMASLGTTSTGVANPHNQPMSRPFTSAALSPPRHAATLTNKVGGGAKRNSRNSHGSGLMERISPPMAYRVFAPETQAAFVQNMAHINDALSEDYTATHRGNRATKNQRNFKS